MRLFEVKNDIAKIVYNPAENHLLPSDFLLVEDKNQKLIAQIINIETTDDSNNNLAVLRLALSIDMEDNLSLYNGYIPSKESKIIYINPDEIMELVEGAEANIYFGNLAYHSSCFVKPSISFLNDKLFIQSDRDDKTSIIVQNIITELQNKEKNTVLLDFDGRYDNLPNSINVKITDDFKLPLNIDAFNTILENDIVDCPLEDKAVIQSIILELREYLQTLKEKYLPFTMFKNVVDDEFLSNPVSGLMLFRNKLWLYAQDSIFAENSAQINAINRALEESKTVVIDASVLDEKWFKFVVLTVLNLIQKPCYYVLSLNDVPMDKKSITALYNKFGVVPVVSTSYDCNFKNIIKSVCKNQVLCKPSKYHNEDEKYSAFLSRINDSEMILYGETTLYLPLILDIQLFTSSVAEDIVSNEIKKDVDKMLASGQSVISPENLVPDLAVKEEETLSFFEPEEDDDDLTDSDLDFLDEQNAQLNNQETVVDEEEAYTMFSPIEVEEDEPIFTPTQEDEQVDSLLDDASEDIIVPIQEEDKDVTADIEVESQAVDVLAGLTESDILMSDEEQEAQEEEISPLDDIIQGITNKLDSGEVKPAENVSAADIFALDDDEEDDEAPVKAHTPPPPPPIKENINTKKSPNLTVYETDEPESLNDDIPFKIGDAVYHPKHGKGVVEGFANYSNKILFCQIDFENVGRRILDPRIAGIEKIS